MDISVVVVEPRYQINLGYIARTCMNFSVNSLVLVNPKCRHLGRNAVKYAKHGLPMLERARICGSLGAATAGTFSIGSTGIWRKGKRSLYNIYAIDDMAAMLSRNGVTRLSVVLGREATGLTPEELGECSSVAYIPLKGGYPIMNISHALAILLYELFDIRQRPAHLYADSSEIGNAMLLFRRSISGRADIRSKRTVSMAMEHVLQRSHPTKSELRTLSVAFSANRTYKEKARKGKKEA